MADPVPNGNEDKFKKFKNKILKSNPRKVTGDAYKDSNKPSPEQELKPIEPTPVETEQKPDKSVSFKMIKLKDSSLESKIEQRNQQSEFTKDHVSNLRNQQNNQGLNKTTNETILKLEANDFQKDSELARSIVKKSNLIEKLVDNVKSAFGDKRKPKIEVQGAKDLVDKVISKTIEYEKKEGLQNDKISQIIEKNLKKLPIKALIDAQELVEGKGIKGLSSVSAGDNHTASATPVPHLATIKGYEK